MDLCLYFDDTDNYVDEIKPSKNESIKKRNAITEKSAIFEATSTCALDIAFQDKWLPGSTVHVVMFLLTLFSIGKTEIKLKLVRGANELILLSDKPEGGYKLKLHDIRFFAKKYIGMISLRQYIQCCPFAV